MYDNTIKNQFVELRAAGKTFGEIAEQLGVAKSTLHAWAEERADDVAHFRRIQWEEWEAEARIRIEDRMEDLVCNIADYEFRLRDFTNNLNNLNLRDTVMLLRESRREYYRLRALLMGTDRPSRKSNKTERSHENGTTQRRGNNDLQQPKTESFDSVTSRGANSVEPQTSSQPPTSQLPSSAYAANDPPNISVESAQTVVIEESNKTERSTETGTTQPPGTNDLQQSQPESFDSVPSQNVSLNSCELMVTPQSSPPVTPETDERPWWEREPTPNGR